MIALCIIAVMLSLLSCSQAFKGVDNVEIVIYMVFCVVFLLIAVCACIIGGAS